MAVKFTKQEKNVLGVIVALLAIVVVTHDAKTRNANANTSPAVKGFNSQGKSY